MKRAPLAVFACLVVLISFAPAAAAETVALVIGKDAPAIEQLAGRELAGQFEKLFGAKVVAANSLPAGDGPFVMLGTPKTNSQLAEFAGSGWPRLSNQGIHLRSVEREGRRGLAVVGGSPAAVLAAVYELGHHFGIRYLLEGDIYPEPSALPDLAGINVTQETTFRIRGWELLGDSPLGSVSWGLDEHKAFLKQLAKLRFNHVVLRLHPWQPFVHYKLRGTAKTTGVLFAGNRFRIDGDTPGRTIFRGAKEFTNPDLADCTTYDERVAAGTRLVRAIIDAAHELGIKATVCIAPLEFPREFAALLPGATTVPGTNGLAIAPGKGQPLHDSALRDLVTAKVTAYATAYRQADALCFALPDVPQWHNDAAAALKQLQNGADERTELAALHAAAAKIAPGDAAVTQVVDAQLKVLSFLNSVDRRLRSPLVVEGAHPALYPVLARLLPKGSFSVNAPAPTARRGAKLIGEVVDLPPDVRGLIVLPLAEGRVGLLTQSATGGLHELLALARHARSRGYVARCTSPAALDPSVYYLSRAAFDADVSPRSAGESLFVAITGKPAVADRLYRAFEHIEAATDLLDEQAFGHGAPKADMLIQYYHAGPLPAWRDKLTDECTQAMIELYRSHGASADRGRAWIYNQAKRSEYVLGYLNAAKALQASAAARKAGDADEALAQLETAVEAMHDAIDTLADVAGTQCDRALVAVLTEYAYRPLLAEYEKRLDE